jgi:hypothetical protein
VQFEQIIIKEFTKNRILINRKLNNDMTGRTKIACIMQAAKRDVHEKSVTYDWKLKVDWPNMSRAQTIGKP